MSIIVKCKNVAAGQFTLVPGQYHLNQPFLDFLRVLVNENDLTGWVHTLGGRLKYNINQISLVNRDTTFINTKRSHGTYFPGIDKIYIAPDVIARLVANIWLKDRLFNCNYGVNGTIILMWAILHEITHSRVHGMYTPQGKETEDEAKAREEAHVIEYTNEQARCFIQKYHLGMDCTHLMYGLITRELVKCPLGRDIALHQESWLEKNIAALTREGAAIMTLRDEYRRQYFPREDWPSHTRSIETAITLLDENDALEAEVDYEENKRWAEKRRAEVAAAALAEEEAASIIMPSAQEVITSLPESTSPPSAPPDPIVMAVSTTPPPPPPPPAPPVVVAVAPPPPPPPPPAPPVVVAVAPPPPPPAPPQAVLPPEPPLSVYEYLYDDSVLLASLNEEVVEDTTQLVPSSKDLLLAIQESTTYNAVPVSGSMDLDKAIQDIGYALFCHIFEQCGFDPKDPKAVNGFTNTDAVLKDVDLRRCMDATKYISHYITLDARGKYTVEAFKESIRGRKYTGGSQLPYYEVTFKDGSSRAARRFIPQSQFSLKKGTTELSDNAQAARDGACIMWVLDPGITDDLVDRARANKERATKFTGKYIDYNFIKIK